MGCYRAERVAKLISQAIFGNPREYVEMYDDQYELIPGIETRDAEAQVLRYIPNGFFITGRQVKKYDNGYISKYLLLQSSYCPVSIVVDIVSEPYMSRGRTMRREIINKIIVMPTDNGMLFHYGFGDPGF